jgi:hypothetical protein
LNVDDLGPGHDHAQFPPPAALPPWVVAPPLVSEDLLAFTDPPQGTRPRKPAPRVPAVDLAIANLGG